MALKELTEKIEKEIKAHPGPNQVYVILFGGNNLRKTTKPVLEVAKVVSCRIMIQAQQDLLGQVSRLRKREEQIPPLEWVGPRGLGVR
jgi:hypothetical protein